MDNNLEYKKIKSIKRSKKKQKVYNFNVPGYESYVANGFVVHNCENHEISQQFPPDHSKVLNPSQIVDIAIEKHCRSISMSYNEPTLSYEYLIDLAKESASNRLPFVLKTNAFINQDPWKEICAVTQAINIDWKGGSDSFKRITRVSSYVLKHRIKEAYDYGVHLEINIPLYNQGKDIEEFISEAGEFLSSLDSDIPCHILRISPSYDYDNFIYSSKDIDRAKNILSGYMNNIYIVV